MVYIFLIAGIAKGIIIGLIISKIINKKKVILTHDVYNGITTEINELKSKLFVAEEKIKDNLNTELKSEREKVLNLSSQFSARSNENENLKTRLLEQKLEIEAINEKLRIEFKNLANDILEEKSKRFTEQNKVNITEVLKPLSEKIKEFEKRVEETYDKESKQRYSLETEIKRLHDLNQQISKEAHNLTQALKGQSKTQGTWGEIILESILEKSGLVLDREYFVQQSHTNDEGKRIQPDIIIKYPGERYVVIDSKISLTAYERYCSAESQEEQELALKEHIISVKNHINELSAKNYQDVYKLKSLDFVMMFLPIEPSYMLAIQKEPDLWNYAYDKRIVLISPTNLIAALKLIVTLWRQEYQNRNATEIAEQSGALLDKFYSLLEDLKDVGNKLLSTQKAYDASMNKLSEGKGNLITRTKNIQELGVKNKKQLPSEFLEKQPDTEQSRSILL